MSQMVLQVGETVLFIVVHKWLKLLIKGHVTKTYPPMFLLLCVYFERMTFIIITIIIFIIIIIIIKCLCHYWQMASTTSFAAFNPMLFSFRFFKSFLHIYLAIIFFFFRILFYILVFIRLLFKLICYSLSLLHVQRFSTLTLLLFQ